MFLSEISMQSAAEISVVVKVEARWKEAVEAPTIDR